jgi:hypothetical protein
MQFFYNKHDILKKINVKKCLKKFFWGIKNIKLVKGGSMSTVTTGNYYSFSQTGASLSVKQLPTEEASSSKVMSATQIAAFLNDKIHKNYSLSNSSNYMPAFTINEADIRTLQEANLLAPILDGFSLIKGNSEDKAFSAQVADKVISSLQTYLADPTSIDIRNTLNLNELKALLNSGTPNNWTNNPEKALQNTKYNDFSSFQQSMLGIEPSQEKIESNWYTDLNLDLQFLKTLPDNDAHKAKIEKALGVKISEIKDEAQLKKLVADFQLKYHLNVPDEVKLGSDNTPNSPFGIADGILGPKTFEAIINLKDQDLEKINKPQTFSISANYFKDDKLTDDQWKDIFTKLNLEDNEDNRKKISEYIKWYMNSYVGNTGNNIDIPLPSENILELIENYNEVETFNIAGKKTTIAHLEKDPAFQEKLSEMIEKYPRLTKDEIYRVIKGESNGNTQALHQKSNAAGLFQFMPFVALELGTSTNEILNMSATEQLNIYDKYLQRWNYRGGSLAIMQAAPAMANKGDNHIVYAKDTPAWQQNPGWRDQNGDITIASIDRYYMGQSIS